MYLEKKEISPSLPSPYNNAFPNMVSKLHSGQVINENVHKPNRLHFDFIFSHNFLKHKSINKDNNNLR